MGDGQYVGMDFHRRRSVIVRADADGTKLSTARVANDPLTIAATVAEAGGEADVVVEATYGWYWVVDMLQRDGHVVHLANPQGLNWGQRRVKNDERDAIDLADMLRLGRLPEAWIAPPVTRELRELVRYRAKLAALRTGLKAQVHAVLAKEGVLPAVGDVFGPTGARELAQLDLAPSYRWRVESLRRLIGRYDVEIRSLERMIHARAVRAGRANASPTTAVGVEGPGGYGFDVMLKKATVEWVAPARYRDHVAMDVRVERWGTSSFDVVVDGHAGGRPSFTATVVYVSVVPGTADPVRVPAEIRAALDGA
jgi:hypothetical protein